MSSDVVIKTFRVLLASAALVATGCAPVLAQADPVIVARSDREKAAVALVRSWADALVARQAEAAAAMLDENVAYRDDPFQTEPKYGRAHALADIQILLRGLTGITIEEAYAIGGEIDDTLVLTRRTDYFTLPNGLKVTQPMGGYFRVRNGKILEWLDTPLKTMPPAKGAPKPDAPAPAK